MSAIIQAIQDFFSMIGQVIMFLVQIVKDLLYTINLLRYIVPGIPSYMRFLPPAIAVSFVGCMSIIIVYKIIGRD